MNFFQLGTGNSVTPSTVARIDNPILPDEKGRAARNFHVFVELLGLRKPKDHEDLAHLTAAKFENRSVGPVLLNRTEDFADPSLNPLGQVSGDLAEPAISAVKSDKRGRPSGKVSVEMCSPSLRRGRIGPGASSVSPALEMRVVCFSTLSI